MATVTHGTHCPSDKIFFTGRNTARSICWKTSADTYKGIYDNLIDMKVISQWDYSPVEKYILEKLGKTYDDYTDDYDDIDYNKLYLDGDKFLVDEAYREIISNEDGNAYYQEWEVR